MAALLEQSLIKEPHSELGPDIFHKVLQNLSSSELALAALVCREWCTAAQDVRLWTKHCQALWQDKVFLPGSIRNASPRKAYGESLRDSKRVAITKDELCSLTWHFRFKVEMWFVDSDDPMPDMVRFFHHNGTFTSGTEDPWSDIEYRWQFRSRKEGRRGVFVQVHTFPPLTASRTPDWGWSLENMYVELTSAPGPARTCACCTGSLAPAGPDE